MDTRIVHPIDPSAWPACKQVVQRSDEYCRHQEKLKGAQIGQLLRLERDLKASGELEHNADAITGKPKAARVHDYEIFEFKNALGTLFYTYAFDDFWMLIEFELNLTDRARDPGADGSGPACLVPPMRLCGGAQWGIAAFGKTRHDGTQRFAACLSGLKRWPRRADATTSAGARIHDAMRALFKSSLVDCVYPMLTSLFGLNTMRVAHTQRDAGTSSSDGQPPFMQFELRDAVFDFLRERCEGDVFSASIIGDKLMSVHQVTNAFARRILFGEHVFSIVWKTMVLPDLNSDTRPIFDYKTSYRVFEPAQATLLRETKDLVDSVLLPQPPHSASNFCHYNVAGLLASSHNLDDRVLYLLRLEMLSNLARVIHRRSCLDTVIVDDVWYEQNYWMTARLIKDLSSFGELVTLSNAYFATTSLDSTCIDGLVSENKSVVTKDTAIAFRTLGCLDDQLERAADLPGRLGLEPETNAHSELRDRMIHLIDGLLPLDDSGMDQSPTTH